MEDHWKLQWGWFPKARSFKEKYEAKKAFLGWGEAQTQKPFLGGVDIF